MRTIEERARDYAKTVETDYPDIVAHDYETGAKEERLLLLEWHTIDEDQFGMAHDITHCDNDKCPTKEHCHRWLAYVEAVEMKLPQIDCAIIDEETMADGICLLFWEYEHDKPILR